MNIPLFCGIIGFLSMLCLWIGNRTSKGLQNNEEYFLMGRNLSLFPLLLTLLATQLGGGTILGATEEAFHKGWVVLWYPAGACFGLIMLGLGFGSRLRQFQISTVAEIFEKIYGSRKLRLFASSISVVTLFIILIGQGIASQKLFASLGMTQPLFFILFWLVLVTYTVMGGFKAVVQTDVLQALFILAVLFIAFFSINTSQVPLETAPAAPEWAGGVSWINWFLMPFFFMLIEQDMGQRCFAAKNGRAITVAAILSGFLLFLGSAAAMSFGILARKWGIQGADNASILIRSVEVFTTPTIATFFMAAIFMAVISTADSLLCSISSNLSCDFLADRKISEKRQLWLSRLLTLLTGLGSLVLSFFFHNVVSVLMFSYELSVNVLFIPTISAILFKQPSRKGAVLAIICGGACTILFRIIPLPMSKEIATLGIAGAGYCLGLLMEGRNRAALEPVKESV